MLVVSCVVYDICLPRKPQKVVYIYIGVGVDVDVNGDVRQIPQDVDVDHHWWYVHLACVGHRHRHLHP